MWGRRIVLALTFLALLVISDACVKPAPLDPTIAFLRELVAVRWPDGHYKGEQMLGVGGTPFDEEWIVFYRKRSSNDPIACTVYWLSVERCQQEACDEMPSFVAYDLPECACKHECQAEKRDLLSEHDGDELVVWDKDNDQQKKLYAYTWITGTKPHYSLAAHFYGNRVEAGKDWVKARIPILGAAPIEFCCEYSLLQKKPVYRNNSRGECECDFAEGTESRHALKSPHPEMVVLAYYKNCAEPGKVKDYFTDTGWEDVGKGEGEQWICPAAEPITSTRVIHMTIAELRNVPGPLGDKCPEAYQMDCPNHDCPEDMAYVTAAAKWDDKQNDVVGTESTTETWKLLWKGDGWRIESSEEMEVGMAPP